MFRWRFLSIVLLCVMLSSCFEKKTKENAAETVSVSIPPDTVKRTSITFILGKDENTRNPYYSLANQYYRLSDSEKTEIVIDTFISLKEVRNYLDEHRPANGHPWGLVNLVTHGNEFIDLSVLISRTGARVSGESLTNAIADSVLRPLDSLTADNKTLFNIHGCAVGNNTALLKLIGIAFGGKSKPARVKASKLFEYYSYISQDKNPKMIRHYYARVWYAYYKADSLPDNDVLSEQLRNRYPNDCINWPEAINRQYPSNPSEAYHINLNIPVIWEDFYENKKDLPDFRTKTKQLKWVERKTEFQALMKKTGIPKEYFNIKLYMLIYDTDKGPAYSNKVKAKAGAICIIKPMLRGDDNENSPYAPFVPAADDGAYFCFAGN